MKELKATIKIFDEKSDINEIRKYIGKNIMIFQEPPEGIPISMNDFEIETLNSVSVFEDSVSFETDHSNCDKFAIIEIDNQ